RRHGERCRRRRRPDRATRGFRRFRQAAGDGAGARRGDGAVKAAVFHGPGDLRVEPHAEPTIARADEVIVEVEACGICGTDLQILNVPPGHPATPGVILGHEFIGRAVTIGPSVRDLRVGQRVVVDPDPKCGTCHACRTGRPANCTNVVALGSFADGALARFAKAPASSVYPIAETLAPPVAARIVLFGQNANALPAIKQYTITERSLSILGSYITTYTFPTAIRLVEQGKLPLAAIVSRVIGLDDIAEGLALLRSGDATKVVITP